MTTLASAIGYTDCMFEHTCRITIQKAIGQPLGAYAKLCITSCSAADIRALLRDKYCNRNTEVLTAI